MEKKWLINAPNGTHVNVSGFGHFKHGEPTTNAALAMKFPHICIEVFEESGPKLLKEPAPAIKNIEEVAPVLQVIEEVAPMMEVISAPQEEDLIEEKFGKKDKKNKK